MSYEKLKFNIEGIDITFVEVSGIPENPFYIMDIPVTQFLWTHITGSNPSEIKSTTYPVTNITRSNALSFLIELQNRINSTVQGVRLMFPSILEWRYAALGGNYAEGYHYSGSDKLKQVGWYRDNSENRPMPVKTKLSNELMIYDMSGNVWEMLEDHTTEYHLAAGGCYISPEKTCLIKDFDTEQMGAVKKFGFEGHKTLGLRPVLKKQ